MKLKHAHIIGSLAVLVIPHAISQGLLAQAHLTIAGIGASQITDSINLKISIGPPPTWLFEDLVVQSGDVGHTYTIGPNDAPVFAAFVTCLTDDYPSDLGYVCTLGNMGAGVSPFLEADFFTGLPPGNNGIDLGGFEIDHFSLRFDAIDIVSPGRNPNGDGVWTDCSCAATFSVYGHFAVRIVAQPLTQTAEMGSLAFFCVGVTTNAPGVAYQWFFNGTNALSGATNSYLHLSNIQPVQAGAYSVVVTNMGLAVTSAPALLSVIPPVERRPIPALTLMGQPGSALNLDFVPTLDPASQWTTFDNVLLTQTSQWYFDLSTPLPPQGFYRAWQPGPSSVIPSLNLNMVPAITLTGSVGSSVRLDYINAIGPTNAWVTLTTVTLTNISQLYFDTSALGQPRRLYRLVAVPSAQSYRVLKSFTGRDGSSPVAAVVLAGSTLYGTTHNGGILPWAEWGVVFRVNTDGSDYTLLRSFNGTDGNAAWGLVLAGSTLYGTTEAGGISSPDQTDGYGVVYKVNTDGSGYTVLKSFTGGDGAEPSAGLVLAGGTLYGTTSWGGSSDLGTVFKVSIDGSGYAVLKSFTGGDGAAPFGSVSVLAGGTLYGTTPYGGNSFSGNRYSGGGVVFKVNTDGSSYAVLKNFNDSDGLNPVAGLLLAGGKLYGTTWYGGSSNLGVVFKVNTDGSSYAVLKNFTGNDGKWPMAGLVLAGGMLYGTTWSGGSSDDGVVFRVNTDGWGYAVLKNFTGEDGARPCADLVLVGSTFYGTTQGGGSGNSGVVFSLACPSR